MVHHKEVPPLYTLCHRQFVAYLGKKVVKASYDESRGNATLSAVRQKLRPFFIENIPSAVRTTLLQETADYLLSKSQEQGFECFDYGRSILYLLHLLLSKEVKRLAVTLCCYYGCRDLEGVLRCIKKNGSSLEQLELSRSSLLRMDPFLFRNVLTAANLLITLIVKNICSDAMLKLIGTHCLNLQYLDISNSKQVSDTGIDYLVCQVQIRDKMDVLSETSFESSNQNRLTTIEGRPRSLRSQHQQRLTVREDFNHDDDHSNVGCSKLNWKNLRLKMRSCLASNGPEGSCTGASHDSIDSGRHEILVEITQVLQPICATLTMLDITGTSITSTGLLCILRKLNKVQSLGEYNISDGFLRSLCVVSSLQMDKFSVRNLHARKISDVGMYNMVHVFPFVETFTCWEPAFDLTDLIYFCHLKQLTLCRVIFSEAVFHQLLKFFQTCRTYFHHDKHGVTIAKDTKLEFCKLEKVVLEFVLQDEFTSLVPMIDIPLEFDIGRIFQHCDNIKVFSVEFKDNILQSPPVGYSSVIKKSSLKSLVYVQLGQIVQNTAVEAILRYCPHLKHFHCNQCPRLSDLDLSALSFSCSHLECFYIYEAPLLTINAFQLLLEGFPRLQRFGNLTRWAVNCEGIQQVVRTIKENNLDITILCGSHWFTSSCAEAVHL